MPIVVTPLLTVLALVLAVLAGFSGVLPPVAAFHLAFAGGILPLVFAAIGHFVPVLTRTGEPPLWIRLLPEAVRLAGLMVVAVMAAWLERPVLYAVAAFLMLLAMAFLLWVGQRAKVCLGAPHPGWRWYGLALGCLIVALLAVLAMAVEPEGYLAWRLLHLHLNVLGLVGLAALGTLPVLLPTAIGQPDPFAAPWLRRKAVPAVLGVLLLAIGAAWFPVVAVAGGGLLVALLVHLLAHWFSRFGALAIWQDGAVLALFMATASLAALLVAGAAQGLGLWQLPPFALLLAWGVLFLLPLVSGALGQLLPVWRWSGPATPARAEMRRRLLFASHARLAALVFAGTAVLAGEMRWALGGVLLALGLIAFGLFSAMHVRPAAR